MTRLRRREFFERVPDLFDRGNHLAWERYEETLFHMTRPLTHGNYNRILQFVGGNPPVMALRDARPYHELDRILSKAKYPRAGQLSRLSDYAQATTELATAILHFNNPAYPIYDATTVKGLQSIGYAGEYVREVNEEAVEAYQGYLDTIQSLKEDIPFYHVPEKNYYLTRVIQLSLWELGREILMRNGHKQVQREAKPTA